MQNEEKEHTSGEMDVTVQPEGIENVNIPEPAAEIPAVEEAPAKEAPAVPPVAKKKRHIVFIVIVAVLVALGVAFWIFKDSVIGLFVKQTALTDNAGTVATISALENQKKNDTELISFITPKTGETWLATPKALPLQGWLAVEQLSYYQDVGVGTQYYESAADQLAKATPTYKEIGSRDGNTIVLVESPSEGMAGAYYLFEKRQDGTVAAIVKPQANGYVYDNMLSSLKASVTSKVTVFDEATHYDSLNIPSKIALENGEYVLRPEYLNFVDSFGVADGDGVQKTLIAKLGGSSLYKTEVKYADTGLTNIGYYVQLPIGTKVSVRYEPNQNSLEGYTFDNGVSLQYTTAEGKSVYDTVFAIARGCGGNSAAVTRSEILKESDLVQIGKTNTGRAVYGLKDTSSALYKKAYDEYSQSYGADAVSFSDYLKYHGLVVMKNAAGELLVYVRGQYAMVGGCAKPVVYLYPQTPTVVSVKVGADVTVSDPEYTTSGWRNVLAMPSGQLSYRGLQYDSLFWEGVGHGSYPGITSGTIVARSEAAATIRRQLFEQGLNTKEANDFMAFWENKIPNKPYIRLTWLTTEQMDMLAPLSVSPKPDTILRVFLDMDGLEQPIKLPAQQLSGTFRKGFTVVEWGGLTSEIRR